MWETLGGAAALGTGGLAAGLFPGLAGLGGLGGAGAGGFDLASLFGGAGAGSDILTGGAALGIDPAAYAAASTAGASDLAGLGGAGSALGYASTGADLAGAGAGGIPGMTGTGLDALYGTFGPGATNAGASAFDIPGSFTGASGLGGGMPDLGGGITSVAGGGANPLMDPAIAASYGADPNAMAGLDSAALPANSTLDVGGAIPGGGTFGGGTGGGGIMDWITKNPMMAASLGLGGAGIIKNALNPGNQGDAQLLNLAQQAGGAANNLTHQANQLLKPELTGKLPPQLEAQVQQALHDATVTEQSKYASLGLSNSTMSADQQAYLQLQTEAMRGQLAQQLAQTGTTLMSQATQNLSLENQIYGELMQQQIANDQQLSNSITGFAGMLAYSTVAGQRRVA